MTLLDTIRRLGEWNAQQAIYAAWPWEPTSSAIVAVEPEDRSVPSVAKAQSCRFFCDVVVARAFAIGWRAVREQEPTIEEICDELIEFAMKIAKPDA